MSQKLYEEYDSFIKRGFIKKDIPVFVTNNLSQKMPIRPYQIDGLSRFFYYMSEDTEKKQPVHLLFNMATGSGKTYMMAGSILYLYKQGYRKFLFFVNSRNIIIKTRENFIESGSNKYLFADKILFGAKQELYNVHKSYKHSEGDECFGGGWFVVQMTLPTGQISNHYKNEHWDEFKCEERERAGEWDGHTPQEALQRMIDFLK